MPDLITGISGEICINSRNHSRTLRTRADLWHLHPIIPEIFHDGCDYNGIKNFKAIKIIRRIAISNTFPDIIPE